MARKNNLENCVMCMKLAREFRVLGETKRLPRKSYIRKSAFEKQIKIAEEMNIYRSRYYGKAKKKAKESCKYCDNNFYSGSIRKFFAYNVL